MNHYSIMLVPDSGQIRSYRISRRLVVTCATALVALFAFGSWGAYSLYSTQRLAGQFDENQQLLEMARARYEAETTQLRGQIVAEQKKMAVYARSLGQMQARLSRLDSLGERLVKVASLDKSEFDFGVKPALGGPRQVLSTMRPEVSLYDHVQSMNSRLSHLDTQLAAIDYILQGNRMEGSSKPHAWPSEGGWLSSPYGMRADPFTGERAMHRGIDIANRFGAPVLATNRGVVTFAGKMRDYGYLVEVQHGYGYKTRFGHLSSIAVKVGDEVKDNQLIGRVGSSGRSTGPHLHYEVHRYGQSLNPKSFLPRG